MVATGVTFSFDFIINFTHQTEYTHGPGTYYQDYLYLSFLYSMLEPEDK